ncbi:hypothetical protein H4S02_000785 [Coemansia sp. RSA 2611]|nr:hypothetical protein H4S02_000785 [Coemansia sp. RSA 2611]
MHEDISGKFRGRDSELEGCADTPGTLFACLSEFVTSACQSRCIVLIDAYDKPFRYAKDKPWSDCVQQTYAALLKQILDSSLLLKAMLTCSYAAPLEADSESILDVVPATYNCRQIQATADLNSEYALGAVFGFTRPEVTELMKMSSAPKHADFMLNRYGGYDFGYSDARYDCRSHIELLGCLVNSWNGDTSLPTSFKRVSRVDYKAEKATLANWARVVMLASCLVSDFDHGESSCFIWPSLQLKDNHCASAADAIHNFVLDPLVYPDAVRTEASIDSFVSLTLYLGYLTVGVDNSLRIPNNGMRDLWEQIRLMATFGTWDQIQQDIAQHQLIDSLFSGKASVVRDDFESVLMQLLSDGGSYSETACLELVCRYVASGLTLSKYTVSKDQRSVAYDRHFLSQPQFGKTWAIELLPFGRYIQRLVLLFRFSLIAQEEAMASSAGASEQLALDSLNKIVENSDAQPFAHCDVRLDLGVALGNGEVVVKQRLWKRVNDDQMDTSESAGNHENLRRNDGESTAEWAQRLRAMDNRGWLDSLGWMTQSTDQE